MTHLVRHATLVAVGLIAAPAQAYLPCSFVDPSAACTVMSEVTNRISFSAFDSRVGFADALHAIGGNYGSSERRVREEGRFFETYQRILGSESVLTTSTASTTDSTLFSMADTFADLPTGTLRARLSGVDATTPPASLLEYSYGQLRISASDVLWLSLPAGFSGGVMRFQAIASGVISEARPGAFGAPGTYVQVAVTAGNSTGSSIFTDEGPFRQVFTREVTLPALSDFRLPVSISTVITMDSGAGKGAYAIDMYNTVSMSVEMPAGVQWTSQSGVFLSAIPEPETTLLFALGTVILAARHRLPK